MACNPNYASICYYSTQPLYIFIYLKCPRKLLVDNDKIPLLLLFFLNYDKNEENNDSFRKIIFYQVNIMFQKIFSQKVFSLSIIYHNVAFELIIQLVFIAHLLYSLKVIIRHFEKASPN